MPVIELRLTEYEAGNLAEALKACLDFESPLCALDTGDWLRQILNALPKDLGANASAEEMKNRARLWSPQIAKNIRSGTCL